MSSTVNLTWPPITVVNAYIRLHDSLTSLFLPEQQLDRAIRFTFRLGNR